MIGAKACDILIKVNCVFYDISPGLYFPQFSPSQHGCLHCTRPDLYPEDLLQPYLVSLTWSSKC